MLALTIESLKLVWIKAKYFRLFKTKEERNSPKSPQHCILDFLKRGSLNIHCYLPPGNARKTYAQKYYNYFMDKCVQTIFLRHIILLS